MNEHKPGLSYFRKEIFIVAYIVFNYDHYIGRMVELGFTAKGLLFIALFLCVLAVLFMVASIRLNSLRIFYGVLLFWSSVLVDSYMNITSTFLTYSSFIAMLDAREFAGEAWTQYSVPILTSVAVSSLLLIGISLKPRKKPPLPGWSLASSPLIMVLMVAGVVYQGGRGASGLPSPFTSLAYSSLAIYEASTNVIGDRKGIEIQRKDIRIGYDIVLIVDESILPNYLDINSEYGVRSGLKHVDRPVGIFNYGYAAAVTNCSAGSNLVLRYGGTRDNYLSAISTMPSLWQYAKNAGLTTVYIDAQRTGGGLHNGMTREEIKDIDEFIQFDDVPVMDRDRAAAEKLVELLNNDRPELIFINKMGAHFPINDKYPDAFMAFEPVLPRGLHLSTSEASARKELSENFDQWLLYRNAYRNTILWTVGHFFDIIFQSADLNNAVIIYTSDHGQDLHERGNPGNHTHCSSDPMMEEGLVPLVVIEGANLDTLNWGEHLADNVNGSSHYSIFPTLLSLMHYDQAQAKSVYDIPLSQVTEDERTFNSVFKARLGREPKWKKIDLGGLVIAPELRTGQTRLDPRPVCTLCSRDVTADATAEAAPISDP